MRREPYAGMGKVSKAKGLYLKNEKKSQTAFYLAGNQFATVPMTLILDREALANDLLIYLSVNSFVDRETGTAFPTQEKIAERAKRRDVRTIRNGINHLAKIGWATKIQRGLNKSNIVILHAFKHQKFTKAQLENIKNMIEGKVAGFRRANR